MSSNGDLDVDKEEFYRRLYEMYNRKHSNTFLMTPERYEKMIEEVKRAKSTAKKLPEDYRRVKRFDIVQTPNGERLYSPLQPGKKTQQMFVNTDEMYDIIRDYHLKLNHGGRSRMMVAIKQKYRNITAEIVIVYLALCGPCKNKQVKRFGVRPNKSFVDTSNDDSMDFNDDPLGDHNSEANETSNISITIEKEEHGDTWSHSELYSRGQVDILNVTNDSNEEYQYMMVYREFMNKFIHLRPLKAISVQEIVEALLDIFLVFGAPNILQSKNGLPIVKKICRKISASFPDIKVVAGEGEFCKSAFKGKGNEDILKKLNNWLSESHSTRWHLGLKYVQHSLNTTFSEVFCRTPNEMVFGKNPHRGIASFMSKVICDDLVTESDLKEFLEENECQENSAPKQLKVEESLVLPTEFIKQEPDMDKSENCVDSDDDTL